MTPRCAPAGEDCDLPIRLSQTQTDGAGSGGVAAIVVSVLVLVALVVVLVIVYYRRRLYRLKKELHQVVQYFPEAKDPVGEWRPRMASGAEAGEKREDALGFPEDGE